MLESPGHQHLRNESSKPDGDGPEPLHVMGHEEIFLHHKEKTGNETPELEIKDDLRIRPESPLPQHTDGQIGPRTGKAAQGPVQGIQIKT